MKTITAKIRNEKVTMNKFSTLNFNDMIPEQKEDYAEKFAKETGLTIDEASEELEEINPSIIVMIEHVENDGSEQTKIINWF